MPFAISAGHELTRDTAKLIIDNGGNAFDAAIAAYAVMFIAEPAMASAGASGFATTYFKEKNERKVFDFFSQTPIRKSKRDDIDYYPIHIQFVDASEEFHVGLASSTVPGAIAGIYALHDRYGTIPIAELFQPAISHCKAGVPLDDFQAYDLKLLQDILKSSPVGQDIFFKDDRIKVCGENIQMHKAADFLDFIGNEGPRPFYYGEIATSICRDANERGAHFTREDFESYKVHVHDPLMLDIDKYHIAVPGTPSIGSYGLALYWGLCEREHWDDAGALKYTAENIRNKAKVITQLRKLYPHIDFDLHLEQVSSKGTSHFSILDKDGNAISLTTSIGEGCGYFIPHTDMHMNNMLGETYLLPGGAHSWTTNVRLNSMMTPTLAFKDQDLFLISGSGGASRIPVAIKQVLSNLIHENMSLKESTESPRIHFQENTLHLEDNRDCYIPKGNFEIKRWSGKSLYFGGVNSVLSRDGHLEAWADQRRLGSSGVYE
ncbi:MAG: hypothetical protein HKN09_05850 [Saprospiraceae bacterium]|nr:hypothetical protein [Saprospiraceae bacterium]